MAKIALLVLAGLSAVVLALGSWGARRHAQETRVLRQALEAGRVAPVPPRVDLRELEGLPAPVQRYFNKVLKDGQAVVAAAHVTHRGTFNMGEQQDNWKPFTSDQLVVTHRPGFDWSAQVSMMPGVPVYVHDAYAGGDGVLHAAVLGLVTVADIRGTREAAEGELMRFFAEAAWYPTALLPSQGVRWSAVDAHSAHATLVDGQVSLTMLFTFNDQDLIERVSAPARWRTVGDRMEAAPWSGRFWNYQQRDGMLVPLSGEVSWLLPTGPKPYWRGEITALRYDFAR